MELRLEGGPLDGGLVTVEESARERIGAIYSTRGPEGVVHTYGWKRAPREPGETGPPRIMPGEEGLLVYGGSFSPSRQVG